MVEWWEALPFVQQVFAAMAIGFGGILAVLLAISLVGAELDTDVDVETESLTLKGVLTFLAFFGFGGYVTTGLGGATWLAVVVAFGLGYAAMSLLALVLAWVYGLGEVGNRRTEDALLAEGQVYLTVPGAQGGIGRIHLRLGAREIELEAVTDGEAIPTGGVARVVEVLAPGRVRVEALTALPAA